MSAGTGGTEQGRHLGTRPPAGRGRTATAAVRTLVAAVVAAVALAGLTAVPASAADGISFRDSAQAAANLATHRVTVPTSVREADGLLLFVTSNRARATLTVPPAGWTEVGRRLAGTDTETVLYSRVATSSDAGRSQAVGFSATTKASLVLLAYDGTDPVDPVDVASSAAETTNRTSHTTPGAAVGTPGSYVVSYWADKSSATTGWSLPTGQTRRSLSLGSGTGRITAVASDLGTAAPAGASPARTATADAASRKATMWTVVLEPDQASSPNVAPVASFTASCPQTTCTVDATGSSDTAPGTVASYAWDFGDGSTATGAVANHTYSSAGTRTITLVVTDDQGLASAPATRSVTVTVPPPSAGPGHTALVPDKPRTDTPRISSGEIWDLEVLGNRVFVAGTFTSLANTVSPTTTVNQAYLAAYDIDTGLIDTTFRPVFGGGGVNAVEASPDGTKLFVGGSFNTVNGVARQKVAGLDLTTGAPLSSFAFTQSTNNQVDSLAVSNSTVYVGGRFSRVNGVLMTGLAAVDAATGTVDTSFDNQVSGGIGVNGALTVQQLKLTHDGSKLLVIHTGRKVDGQDRLGMAQIDTATKQLLPWRSRLWDDNLARVGGVTRIYAADISPDDSYFVVTSASGGDAPPISDTAIAYPMQGQDLVEPKWISRHFDSIYSVAVTEEAVYVGGHFGFVESPSANQPWPGLDNVGYGTGQGLGGYGLGDQVVRREHLAALDPQTGTALEWNSWATAFEGNKALEATPRGLFVGGDGQFKGGVRTGRVGFYDFRTVPAPARPDTLLKTPIEGRVVSAGAPFEIAGTATVSANQGGVARVEVEIQHRDTNQYLQADMLTWATTSHRFRATLGAGTLERDWSLPMTITGNHDLQVMAKTFSTNGNGDATKAVKKFESFGSQDSTPATTVSGPVSSLLDSTTFTMTGTASDDKGVTSLSYWFRDDQNRYLQADGTVDAVFNSFRGTPDVVGATAATWSYEVTLPHEGVWRGSATAVDTAGQADLRSAVRDWRVDSTAVAPTVTVDAPAVMTPPFAVPTVVVQPGQPMTFSGTATDDAGLRNVEISLRNTTTRENLGAGGTWGVGVTAGYFRVSPVDVPGSRHAWSYTTPFALSPGSYSFTVRATDDELLTTSSSNHGRLTLSAQVPGDSPPNGVSTTTGTVTVSAPEVALSGTATDDKGVSGVQLVVFDNDTGRYLQDDGQMLSGVNTVHAAVASPGATTTGWTYDLVLPTAGDLTVSVVAFDTAGQQDGSPATVRYRYYPGDLPPGFNAALGQPVDGTAFTEGRIVVTGRAEDDVSIARVEVGIVNSLGQYLSSGGTFTSTTAQYRPAFLNSPGSPASNYSYTTPVIPDGTYTVHVRATDHHNQVSELRTSTGITVTRPPNEPPVAAGSVSCVQNVCSFDARASTDENPTTLTYSWSFGPGQGTAAGPVPKRTYTAPGTYTPTLTVTDEWKVTSTVFTLPAFTITEPAGNAAPAPAAAVSCIALACATSSTGTSDPNTGDTFSLLWSWGDGTATSTGASPSHTYATTGTYTVTLTVTDGWGRAASTTRTVVLAEPAGNRAPTAVFTPTCTGLVCAFSTTGTADPDGDQIRWAWAFGDTTTSTAAAPTKTFKAAGTYPITLTVTDGWNRSATVSQQVTVAPATP